MISIWEALWIVVEALLQFLWSPVLVMILLGAAMLWSFCILTQFEGFLPKRIYRKYRIVAMIIFPISAFIFAVLMVYLSENQIEDLVWRGSSWMT